VQQRSVAGVPAIGYEATYAQDGQPIHLRAFDCFRGGMAFVITFSAYEQNFPADRAAFDQILASWAWT
jgi:hypothetical protein